MSCQQCAKPAVLTTGGGLLLCIDCFLKLQQATTLQNRNLERMMNFLMSEVSGITGLPHTIPFPETPIVHRTGPTVFNNISVTNSSVGVVNTGTIHSVDVAISTLQQAGSNEMSEALTKLSEAVLNAEGATPEARQQALDILSVLSEQAIATPEQRRKGAIRPLFTELGDVIGGMAGLEQIAAKYLPAIIAYFGS